MKLTIYTKENCHQCYVTKVYAKRKGVEIEERSIDDPDTIAYVKSIGVTAAPYCILEKDDGSKMEWFGAIPNPKPF